MSLFFSNEEILNTPPGLLEVRPMQVRSNAPDGKSQLCPIWQTPFGQSEIILKRGEYILPEHYQAIQWDFLPEQIRQYRALGLAISGRHQADEARYTILLYAGEKCWLKFRDEAELCAFAQAYGLRLPERLATDTFLVTLPKDAHEMLPLEELARCKGIRTISERAYRCHREAFHGGWCQFIAHHKEV
jgi:hypothetical protein